MWRCIAQAIEAFQQVAIPAAQEELVEAQQQLDKHRRRLKRLPNWEERVQRVTWQVPL